MGGPNVLYLTVDEWRGECLSALGHGVVRTPNLDRLAARGVLFANHWSVTAPCGPSRASLHTGRYLMGHRSVNNGTPLDDRFTNIAREVRSAGYDPQLFGYTDTAVDPRSVTDPDDPRLHTYEGPLPGFVEQVRLTGEDLTSWARWLAGQGFDVPADPATLYEPAPGYPGAGQHGSSWAPTRFPAELSETAFLTTAVIDWLDRHGDAPWFVHASFIRPHPPFRAPEGYHDLYDADDGAPFRRHPDRDTELAMHPVLGLAAQIVGCDLDEREARQVRATYWGNMAEVDHQIGRLLDHLDAGGWADDTLVVLTSDHGDQMGDHWFVQKLGWFDESYHVPMIVADPSTSAAATRGAEVHAVTESVDVMPTILDWLGIDVPLQCDGASLTPFVRGEPTPERWRTAAHIQWDFREALPFLLATHPGLTMERCSMDIVRDERHKYVHIGDGTSLLFDLAADPDQLHDLGADPASVEVVSSKRAELLEWRLGHDDRTLTGLVVTPSGVVTRRDPRR